MNNIYLIGFMGSGKTSVGRLLAEKMGRRFLDTDRRIESSAGRSITRIFAREGEPRFRALERRAVSQVSRRSNLVVSLGGGAVLSRDNWKRIRGSGVVVYLSLSAREVLRRLRSRDDRPLLEAGSGKLARIRALMARRRSAYERADLRISTSRRSPARSAALIARRLKRRGLA